MSILTATVCVNPHTPATPAVATGHGGAVAGPAAPLSPRAAWLATLLQFNGLLETIGAGLDAHGEACACSACRELGGLLPSLERTYDSLLADAEAFEALGPYDVRAAIEGRPVEDVRAEELRALRRASA